MNNTSYWLSDVHPSPNLQNNPDVYEIENRAADTDGLIEATMASIALWAGFKGNSSRHSPRWNGVYHRQ